MLIALAAALAAFAMVLSGQANGIVQAVEQFYSDMRTSLFSDRLSADHPDIVLISVGDNVSADRATFDAGSRTTIDRARLARLIEIVDEAAPRAIGLDVRITGPSEPAKDAALQSVLREAKARVVLGIRESSGSASSERQLWTDRFVAGTGRAVGHIASIYDGNRVTRFDSGPLALSRTPDSFAVLMARALRPEVRRSFDKIAWLQKVDNSGWFTRWFNLGAQQPFRLLYSEDLLENSKSIPVRALSGRLVMVTSGVADIERHRTPLSVWSGESVPSIYVQAQAAAQLLDGRSVAEPDPRTSRLLLFALAMIAGVIGWYRRPGLHIGGWVIALVALMVLDTIAYAWLGLMLPTVQTIAAWFLGEAAGHSLRRLLSWEERNGHPWPMASDGDGSAREIGTEELFAPGPGRKEQA